MLVDHKAAFQETWRSHFGQGPLPLEKEHMIRLLNQLRGGKSPIYLS